MRGWRGPSSYKGGTTLGIPPLSRDPQSDEKIPEKQPNCDTVFICWMPGFFPTSIKPAAPHHIGAPLERLWTSLECLWDALGRIGTLLDAFGTLLGHLGTPFGRLGDALGRLGDALGRL